VGLSRTHVRKILPKKPPPEFPDGGFCFDIKKDTKARAEELFSDFGITVSDAIIMFLRKSLMVGGVPFDVVYPRHNSETEAAITETREIMAGRLPAKTFANLSEFYADLEADCDSPQHERAPTLSCFNFSNPLTTH